MVQNKTKPLSKKQKCLNGYKGDYSYFYFEEDVREAVRRLIGEVHKRGLDNFVGLREDGVDIKEQIPTLSNFVKEIFGKELCSDDSQQPRLKQTRGGELKSDEGLHSTDNGSPADTFSELWDNPEDDIWDKEYNPDLLPETLKNKEEKQDETY